MTGRLLRQAQCPVDDPATERRKPCLWQFGTALARTRSSFVGYRNTVGYQVGPLARGAADPRAMRSAVPNDSGARPHRKAGGSADQ